jgi:hypothetical protein
MLRPAIYFSQLEFFRELAFKIKSLSIQSSPGVSRGSVPACLEIILLKVPASSELIPKRQLV